MTAIATPSHELSEAVGIYSNNPHLQRFSVPWSRRPLSELAAIIMGQSPPSSFYNLRGEGVPLIQGKADIEEGGTTDRQWTTKPTKFCKAGDLLLTVRAPVGSVAVATRGACLGRGVCGLKPFGDSAFLFFSLLYAEDRWQSLEQGSTFTAANSKQVRQFLLHVPDDQEEQHAIATVLSDVDGLIKALDALITKKLAIKQAAMQQLLTGKIRLPGFRREWATTTLGGIADIKTGNRNNQDKVEDGRYPFFVRSSNVERINSYSFEGEAILIPGEGGIGSIFHYINGRFDVHQRVYKISRFSEAVCGKFVYYTMLLYFGKHAMQNTVKATVDSLRLPTFKNFRFLLPNDIAEQRAIAEILSDVDQEIAALERRRYKTNAIKQGIMQQLLTGRVRLVKPG